MSQSRLRPRAAKAIVACALLAASVGVLVGLPNPAAAGPAIANGTFYWNAGSGNACALCDVTVIVLAWPNTETPPTDNAGVTWNDGSYCLECIQYLAPGADNAFGYYFAQMQWYNMLNTNFGTVGFTIGFTNQS